MVTIFPTWTILLHCLIQFSRMRLAIKMAFYSMKCSTQVNQCSELIITGVLSFIASEVTIKLSNNETSRDVRFCSMHCTSIMDLTLLLCCILFADNARCKCTIVQYGFPLVCHAFIHTFIVHCTEVSCTILCNMLCNKWSIATHKTWWPPHFSVHNWAHILM